MLSVAVVWADAGTPTEPRNTADARPVRRIKRRYLAQARRTDAVCQEKKVAIRLNARCVSKQPLPANGAFSPACSCVPLPNVCASANAEVICHAEGKDGVKLERLQVAFPFADLRLQVDVQ